MCLLLPLFLFTVIPGHCAQHVSVGISIVEPWKFEKDGKLQGAGYELFQAIASELNLQVKYIILPFKRALELMKSGEIDIMFGLLKTVERQEYIHFVEPPYKLKSNKAFYVLHGGERKITSHEDLYKLRVGVKIGAKYFARFDNDRNIYKDGVSEYDENIKKLLLGVIDTFVCTASQADYLIKELGLGDTITKASYEYKDGNPTYVGISKQSSIMSMKDTITGVVEKMVKNGTVDKTFKAYFKKQNLPLPEYK